jgi:hypothetical protein
VRNDYKITITEADPFSVRNEAGEVRNAKIAKILIIIIIN